MKYKLEHGGIKVDLNICNRSYRNALITFEPMVHTMGSPLGAANFLYEYMYQSYAIEFTRVGLKPPIADSIELEEMIEAENKEAEGFSSNLSDVIEQLSNSITSILGNATEQKQESEEPNDGGKKKATPTP